MAPSTYQAGYGVPATRVSLDHYLDPRSRHLGMHNNYFQSEDLVSGHAKRNRALQSDNDHASEPTTPTSGSALDSPMEDLSLNSSGNINNSSNTSKQPPPPQQQPPYVPDMLASHGGFASYQTMAPTGAASGYAQQSYSLADTVVYEPPSGHQSPLFADRLAAEDAALFASAGAGWDGPGPYYG